MRYRTFRLNWLHGEPQTVSALDTGDQLGTLADAMNAAGIGNGALRALDYWREITEDNDADTSKVSP